MSAYARLNQKTKAVLTSKWGFPVAWLVGVLASAVAIHISSLLLGNPLTGPTPASVVGSIMLGFVFGGAIWLGSYEGRSKKISVWRWVLEFFGIIVFLLAGTYLAFWLMRQPQELGPSFIFSILPPSVLFSAVACNSRSQKDQVARAISQSNHYSDAALEASILLKFAMAHFESANRETKEALFGPILHSLQTVREGRFACGVVYYDHLFVLQELGVFTPPFLATARELAWKLGAREEYIPTFKTLEKECEAFIAQESQVGKDTED